MNSRYIAKSALALLAAAALAGCAAGSSAKVRGSGPSMAQTQAQKYDGPQARLAVVRFVDKSAKAGGAVGAGMADMLATALFNTGRFIVLDRQDLSAVIDEQDFGESGRVSGETAAAIGEVEGADLIVIGAVTEFEKERLGAGGVILGALTLGASIAVAIENEDAPIGAAYYTESSVAIDVKALDAKTGRVVYANTVEGRYQNWGGGVIGGVGGGASRVPVILGGVTGTGAEQAVRVCIEAAVKDIVKNTPAEYYRVERGEDVILASQLAPVYPLNLPGPAAGPDERGAIVVENGEQYAQMIGNLDLAFVTEPEEIDWARSKVVAAFAGRKETAGHRIGIDKAIHRKDALEIWIVEAAPAGSVDKEGPEWPFDAVRINDPGKPIRFVWKKPEF